ncbi:acyl-CoA dehydrogenase [Williamsia sp. Leaf354]|uniref:phosphotransferase family protein n=1 Tax=Williamsia sp. Leaf354 TaxID=1736349 RepID=UPI0006FFC0C0|nr:phosphotransferase family protein [Williamsia sp. Leaf354]KQR99365.1 acyl-CoA dehydrogenase [Williamsia sp. Leaf354]
MSPSADLPGMDVAALTRFLTGHGIDLAGDLEVELIAGGRSNLTFIASDGTTKWVVRRPPTSGLTPSAHDMNREWTVTQALQHTAVPVAPTVAFDADGDVLGAPCTVVGFVEGTVIRSAGDLDALDDATVDRNVDALIRSLADLHAVDHVEVGLGEFGRPEGFVARQVKTWTRQWEIVKTRELPDVEKLAAALAENIPTDSANAIVHGDYRVDNTILDIDDPGVVRAVVDWEMSTLGDPLTDVALMCVYRQPIFDRVLGLSAAWTSDRYPDTDELAQRYATAAGIDMAHWNFYLALANFKLGVIGEGIAYRALQGSSSGAGAEKAAEATAEFMATGLRALQTSD